MLNISISSLFNRKVWFCIFIPLILAGCGGGSEEASTGNQQAAAGTDLANEGNSRQKIYSADPSLSTAQAQGLTTNIASSLQPCKLMMFGNSPGYYRCRILAADFYPPQTGDGVGAGPAISQCQTLSVGQAIVASTPPPGQDPADGSGTHSCFQVVIGTQTATYFDVNLPPGVTGMAELYVDGGNGAGYKQAISQPTDSHLNIPFTNQNARMVLTVHTDNGAQGQAMGVGVGATAPAAAPNNSSSSAISLVMNQTFSGTIATPGVDQGYVFYPLRTSQSTAEITATLTSNQTAAYRSVQQTSPNTYVLGAEMAIPYSSSGTAIPYTSPNPANVAGTTTPYGVMVRVSGANTAAPTNEPYSIRVATRTNSINTASLTNTENISRWYPASGLLQVANYVTTNITVKDANGDLLPGETVAIKVQANTLDSNSIQTIQGVTDANGSLVVTVPLAACTGTVQTNSNYGPPGSPTDHYKGTAQDGKVIQSLINSTSTPTTTMSFKRICSETYLGRY